MPFELLAIPWRICLVEKKRYQWRVHARGRARERSNTSNAIPNRSKLAEEVKKLLRGYVVAGEEKRDIVSDQVSIVDDIPQVSRKHHASMKVDFEDGEWRIALGHT